MKIRQFSSDKGVMLGDSQSQNRVFLSLQSFLNSARIAILGSQWKRSLMPSGMSFLFQSLFRSSSLHPASLLLSLRLSLSARSPFSPPSQLLFSSLHPCLPSLGRYLTTVVSFFVPAIQVCHSCLPSSLCPSIQPTLSLSLSLTPFLPILSHRSPLSSLNKLTNDISLAQCVSRKCEFSFLLP